MTFRVAVLPGDGVGPEVTREAVRVLKAVTDFSGFEVKVQEYPIGGNAVLEAGSPFPERTREACLEADAVLLGAVGGPAFDTLAPHLRPEAGLLALRQSLGCFANLRPARSYDAILDCSPLRAERIKGANLMIVRELLGGLYFGEPRGIDEAGKSAFNTMRYSEQEIERVARIAFELASSRSGKLVSVDKANVLETSRLWRKVVSSLATKYPHVKLEHALVDSFAMNLVTNPSRYDVVLSENLFGDILSDEAAVIAGSLGLLPSASIGGKVDLYEPIHGSAPDIAGKGIANPIGAIASVSMLLRYSAKLTTEADSVDAAIEHVLNSGLRTADLAQGNARARACSTETMGSKIAEQALETLNTRAAYHAV